MSTDVFRRYIDIVTESAAQAVTEMDKSQPSHGRDGHVSHSTYGSRDKEGSDYFKGKELPAKPITLKKMEKDALDILKKQGMAEDQLDEIDIDTLNQLASHAVNTMGQGGANFAAGATGGLVGGAIAGGTKKAVDWYYKQKQKKAEAERKKSQQQGVAEDYYVSKTYVTPGKYYLMSREDEEYLFGDPASTAGYDDPLEFDSLKDILTFYRNMQDGYNFYPVMYNGKTFQVVSDKQGVAEGSAPGQAAWKKEMIAKGAVSFQRDQHGGGAVDRIVAYDKDGRVVGGFNRKGVAEGTKALADYIAESERAYSQPVPGDYFAINIREETLFETWVCDETADGIVIYADDAGLALLERYGYLGEAISEGHDFEIDSDEDSVDVVDQGEYDQEGDMAKDDLATIVRAARRLTGMLDDNDNLPEWVQAKITKAADYVDTAADYIESNRERDGEQGSLTEGQYEMMKHNGHVKKFHANNDADAIRFAKDHGAKSLIRLKRGAPPEKVFEQDVAEGKKPDRYHIVGKDGNPADLASYADRASAEQVRDKKYPGAKVQQVGPRGKVKGVTEGFGTDPTQPGTWHGHKIVANRKTPKGSFLILQNKNDNRYEIHRQTPNAVGGLEFVSVHKTPEEMQTAFRQLTGVDESNQEMSEGDMAEAKYQGREVPLGKPMKGDVKKSKVYVRGPKGNVVKVNFGQKGMKIKKNIPGRRKNFRARHNCANPGPRWKARYWSCRAW